MVSDKRRAQQFADEYLRQDGVFVLKIIAFNAGETIVHDLVIELWKKYRAREENNIPTLDSSDIPLKDV